jgi:hypothetical protein
LDVQNVVSAGRRALGFVLGNQVSLQWLGDEVSAHMCSWHCKSTPFKQKCPLRCPNCRVWWIRLFSSISGWQRLQIDTLK